VSIISATRTLTNATLPEPPAYEHPPAECRAGLTGVGGVLVSGYFR
jgi:hypothetical protein